MKLLLASNNKHKADEIKHLFKLNSLSQIELLTPSDVGLENLDIEESGLTLEENAMLKADGFYKLSGIASFADDTGLEIDALDGKPGVHSARFSGEYGNDAMNRRKVLELLKDIPNEKRTARFRTVICFKDNNKIEYIEGSCEGIIVREERGSKGFGYDSIFIPDGFNITFAEMEQAEKNLISHRGKAIKNFLSFLKKNI